MTRHYSVLGLSGFIKMKHRLAISPQWALLPSTNCGASSLILAPEPKSPQPRAMPVRAAIRGPDLLGTGPRAPQAREAISATMARINSGGRLPARWAAGVSDPRRYSPHPAPGPYAVSKLAKYGLQPPAVGYLQGLAGAGWRQCSNPYQAGAGPNFRILAPRGGSARNGRAQAPIRLEMGYPASAMISLRLQGRSNGYLRLLSTKTGASRASISGQEPED